MTIIHAARIDLPSGSDSADDSKRVARWRLTSDDCYDGPDIMLGYSGIPKLVAPYEIDGRENPFYRVVDRECQMVPDSARVGIITNHYSSKFDIQELENKSKELQPLDRTPKVSRRYVEVEEPLVRDKLSHEIIRNTAGDPIIGLKTKRMQIVYDLEGYFGVDPQWLEIINGCMNRHATAIYGRTWAVHQLRFTLKSISPLLFEKGQYYYTVKAELIGELTTWGHRQHVLNAGLREKDFFGGNALRQCRINEVPVTHPVPLDNSGYMIPIATLASDPINAPKYKDVAGFEDADFTVIGLPPTTYQPEF